MGNFKLTGQKYKRAPDAALDALRAHGVLAPYAIPVIGKCHLVTSHAGCQALLRDTENFATDGRRAGRRFSNGLWLPGRMRVIQDNIVTSEGETHRRLRRLSDGPFRKVSIQNLRPKVEAIIDQILDEMAQKTEFDIVSDLAERMPKRVICEILGIPRQDREQFIKWMVIGTPGNLGGMAGFYFTMDKAFAYMRERFRICRATPQPGLLSDLVNAQVDGECLSDDELCMLVTVLFIAGHETTAHLVSTSLWTLLGNEDAREAFMAPGTDKQSAVDEMLRYLSTVRASGMRFVRRDCEFLGREFKRGDYLMGYFACANRDPDVWDNADALDFGRKRTPHLTFGSGPHVCLGLHLARMETEIALTHILSRWPGLQPAKPLANMPWIGQFGVRGLKSLPVRPH